MQSGPSPQESLLQAQFRDERLPAVVQSLGAEFCATISKVIREKSVEAARGNHFSRVSSQTLMDLSAHYGSVAIRRGKGKVIGKYFKRQNTAIQKRKVVSNTRCWTRKQLRRLCSHCGVWLDAKSQLSLPVEAPSVTQIKFCLKCLHNKFASLVSSKGKKKLSPQCITIPEHQLNTCRAKRRRRKRRCNDKNQGKQFSTESLTSNGAGIPSGLENSSVPRGRSDKSAPQCNRHGVIDKEEMRLKMVEKAVQNLPKMLPRKTSKQKQGSIKSPFDTPSVEDGLFKNLGL